MSQDISPLGPRLPEEPSTRGKKRAGESAKPAKKAQITPQKRAEQERVQKVQASIQPESAKTPRALRAERRARMTSREAKAEKVATQKITKRPSEYAESPIKRPSGVKETVERYRQELLQLESTKSLAELEKQVQQELAHYALHEDPELDRFGSKHKNLVHQTRLVNSLEIPGVEVPGPHGFSTDTIEAFLRKEAPEVFTQWAALGALYSQYQGELRFLETPEAAPHLQAIEKAIHGAFSSGKFAIPESMQKWLDECRQDSRSLIVRSSGAEDSSHATNAGGNETVPYVLPVLQPLSLAIGKVVASYFSYGSLQNRINVGINPFQEELQIAVTTQELIGEPIGGAKRAQDIPVSLVLFTNEPLYVGDEQFRVMRISATYGHGNGVVGGAQAIATDTYLVLQSELNPKKLYILSDIQPKTARLGPVQVGDKIELKKLKNPEELVMKSTLDTEMLSRLYHWAVIGERLFGKDGLPTDMEIVILHNTIYPVQARPIIRPRLLPTYLDLRKVEQLAQNPIKSVTQAEMIVPGRGSVVVIDKVSQILAENSLEVAERKFDIKTHLLVISYTLEPANTHPVVNFSGLGMPCLYLAEKKDLEDEEFPLIVCMQNQTISSWQNAVAPYASCISEGFIVHPAKIAISLNASDVLPYLGKVSSQVPQEVKRLLIEMRTATTHNVALDRLRVLQAHPWVTQIDETISRLRPRVTTVSKPYLSALGALSEKVQTAFGELQAVLQKSRGERLRPLFHAKVLETLLTKSATGGVAQYSVAQVDRLARAAVDTITYQERLPFQAHLCELLPMGMHPGWGQFLFSLEPHIKAKTATQFKEFIHSLYDAGTLASWMTLFFPSVVNNVPPQVALENILSQNRGAVPHLMELKELRENISEMKESLAQFAHPKELPEAFNRLEAFSQPFLGGKLNPSPTTSPLTKMASYTAMEEFVDLFDMSIKTLIASEALSDSEKLTYFISLLGLYNRLMATWARDLIPEGRIPILNSDMKSYLNAIQTILTEKSRFGTWQYQSRPSQDFSVSAASMGSGALFERHLPQTLADLFTLIHQNLLVILATLNNSIVTEEMTANLAPKIQQVVQKMDSMVIMAVGAPSRVGIHIASDATVSVRYNVPLRNHSGTIEFCYSPQNDELLMKASLLGQARERWPSCRYVVDALNAIGTVRVQGAVRTTGQEISFTWQLPDARTFEYALEEYYKMAAYSMEQGGYVRTESYLYNFDERCRNRGVGAQSIHFFIQHATLDGKLVFDRYLQEVLLHDKPQSISLSALTYSSKSKEFIDEFLAAWAESPDMPCREFFTHYRTSGAMHEYDESLIRRFLPREDESGNGLILLRIKQLVGDPNIASARKQQMISRYIQNVRDLNPLIALVKEGIKSESAHEWTNLLIQIVESGRGFEQASAIVRKYPRDARETKGVLDALLRQGQGSDILHEQLQSHPTESLVLQVVNQGLFLDEAQTFVKNEAAHSRYNAELVAALVRRGLLIDEALLYCRSTNLQNLDAFRAIRPVIVALYEQSKGDEFKDLLRSVDPNMYMVYELTALYPHLNSNEIAALLQNFTIPHKVLVNDAAKNAAIFKIAEGVVTTKHPISNEIRETALYYILRNSDDIKRLSSLCTKLLKIKGFDWVKFGYGTPPDFKRKLQKALLQSPEKTHDVHYFKTVNNLLFNAEADVIEKLVEVAVQRLEKGDLDTEEVTIFEQFCTHALTREIRPELLEQFFIGMQDETGELYEDILLKLAKADRRLDLVEKTIKKIDPRKERAIFEALLSVMIRNNLQLSASLKQYIKDNPRIQFAHAYLATGKSLQMVLSIAKQNIPNAEFQTSADSEKLALFVALAKADFALEQSAKLAKDFVNSRYSENRRMALEIYQVFADKGSYAQEAQTAAQKALFDDSPEVRQTAFSLLKSIDLR